MSAQPPPIPLKYKKAASEGLPQPRQMPPPPPPPRPRVSHWTALFRVMIVLIILISVTVAYWSFFRVLQPVQRQARSMLGTVTTMSARLDQMDRRWPREKITQTRALYREAYAQLFADRDALEEWLGEIQAQAAPLGLELNVTFGEAQRPEGATNNLAIIPASVELEVLPAPGEVQDKSPYDRVLAFGQGLAGHGKRADLAELHVTGGVDSVSHALLVFNLWAGEVELDAEDEAAARNLKAFLEDPLDSPGSGSESRLPAVSEINRLKPVQTGTQTLSKASK